MAKVIILQKSDEIEIYSTLVAACKSSEEIKYSMVKSMKFPFTYKGIRFKKQEIKK